MHRGDVGVTAGQFQFLDRHAPLQDAGMIGRSEMLVSNVAEIGEGDLGEFILDIGEREPELRRLPCRALLLEVPFAGFTPAEANRSARSDDGARGFIVGDGFPVGVVGFPQ